MRELMDIFVKGDRKTSGGVVLAAECFSDSGSAFFTGVPGLEYGVGVLLRPVHAERAAVHQHDDERLAGRGKRLDQILFRHRQIEAGAVAAGKARLTHRHLFALKATGDTDDCDNDVSILCSRYCRWVGHVVHASPQKLRFWLVLSGAAITDLKLYGVTFFEVNRAQINVLAPERRNLPAID